MPSSDPLPPKEAALFRKVLRCYEHKQYKYGLKFAKQILSNSKYSEHGETLAMKGLTLNGLGRKEEAYEHVRRGLKNDLRSHVCWHVYGLLQRGDKKYDEAIKCYRNALRWDKDNIQILRDLSLLQIQMRDLEGYKETRHQLFKLRPSQHASWIGFAMSYHLLGDCETANSILDTFRQSQPPSETFDYKHSELLLYQNQILVEAGQLERALKHLDEFSKEIVDKLAVKETKGDLLLRMGRHQAAVPVYAKLIDQNPENITYYKKYMEASRVEGDENKQLELYREFQLKYPQSICPRRLPLEVASGASFEKLADEYLRRGLRKGIPPLFGNMRSLYDVPDKVAIVSRLVHGYYDCLSADGVFAKGESPSEPPSALLWTMYYLAQHYDHLRETATALKYIEEAIVYTPTLIELFVTQGRIFRHAGDADTAAEWLDEAQLMDTADRYINSKCAKYMLRANMVKEAVAVLGRFTREGACPMVNLNEMQCLWFQTECALAYQRLGQWGEALKKCHEVDRNFAEMIEDQFDFHTYCMRKMTFRAYVGLLRHEDVLRRHPFAFKSAKCAIEVYLRLYDKPLAQEMDTGTEQDVEQMAPSELKKLRSKQRKAKKKAELETAQAQQAQVKKEQHNKLRQQQQQGDAGEPEAPQLDELIPEKLERTDDPLERAIEFLRPLQLLVQDNAETHLLAFEIYFRRGKVLLMLQSLKRAQRIDGANSAQLHGCLMRFREYVQRPEVQASMNEAVRQVLEAETEKCFGLGKRSIAQLNEEFLKRNANSIEHVLASALVMSTLDNGRRRGEAVKLVTSFPVDQLRLEVASKVFNALLDDQFGGSPEYADDVEAFKRKLHGKFTYATLFKSKAEVEKAIAERKANKLRQEEDLYDGLNDLTITSKGMVASGYADGEEMQEPEQVGKKSAVPVNRIGANNNTSSSGGVVKN